MDLTAGQKPAMPMPGRVQAIYGRAARRARVELARAERREAEVEARRAWLPFNCVASGGVMLGTGFILMAMFGRLPVSSGVSALAFWLFPVWLAALGAGAMLLYRFDRHGTFSLVRRATAVVLAVLVVPVVLAVLPVSREWKVTLEPPPAAASQFLGD